ncbi:MAG: RluA family pseudouridine synthase [Planctomycetaceae bacterium]
MTANRRLQNDNDPAQNRFTPLEILCEDGPVIAINKPAGLLTQGGPPGNPETAIALVKSYLKEKYQKPGNVYLGVPHRLDRPVTGVLALARNSKAAARLAEQFRERQVRKIYWAVVEGIPHPEVGELVDWLVKLPDQAHVEVADEEDDDAKECRLRYRTLATIPIGSHGKPQSIVEVELLTGRSHQIRVQLSSRGYPIVGDVQYGAESKLPGPNSTMGFREHPIALHARMLTILHPVRYEPLTITAPAPKLWRKWTSRLPSD